MAGSEKARGLKLFRRGTPAAAFTRAACAASQSQADRDHARPTAQATLRNVDRAIPPVEKVLWRRRTGLA